MKKAWPANRKEEIERKENRKLLGDHIRKEFDFSRTHQSGRVPEPPFRKPVSDDDIIIELPSSKDWSSFSDVKLTEAIANRRSRRSFSDGPLDLEELSFLLWATQGMSGNGMHFHRTVPSAGARHSFETYLAIGNVKGLKEGIYRYVPDLHSLVMVRPKEEVTIKVARASFSQTFIADSAVVFIWTTIPYRMEWRYGPAAHRVIAMDAGHLCQNLYLAVEAVNAGTCGIGAYDQDLMDRLIGVDGEDEFVIYMAPVGKQEPMTS